jgi:uncharacterized protein (TIGR02217 family)
VRRGAQGWVDQGAARGVFRDAGRDVQRAGFGGGEGDERLITRPVAGSVSVAVGGVGTLAFSVEPGGWVVLDVAPALGAVVTAGFAFDVLVRFAEDRLSVARATFLAGVAASVPLVEVREA